MARVFLAAFALVALATTAGAEVVDKSAGGFTTKTTVTITATPAQVYAALGRVGEWWDPAHTYSGDARNMTIESTAGACFCERLANGGSIQHGVVAYANPNETLRVLGALGPLQELGVSGSLTWALQAAGSGTTATVTYVVGGYAPGGLDTLAAVVDQVIGTQLTRLKAAIEK
ncbi:MAG: SRPBCC family protein [Vicinamibacterales bacterium]